MNLAYKYPIVYWNTANLIVDSGGIQIEDIENEDEEETEAILIENSAEYEDDEEEEWEEANFDNIENMADKKKKKVKVVDYGRIASIIGKMGNYGIKVSPPDINKSSFTLYTYYVYYSSIIRVSRILVNTLFKNIVKFL